MRLQNGVDIVAVARMEKSLQREGFLRRCFSPEEQEYICRKANPAETAAALWAAKEAFGKALGVGLSGWEMPQAAVTRDAAGAPRFALTGAAAALAEGVEAQAAQSLANVEALLTAAGATFADVVKTTVYLADIADFAAVNEIYASKFEAPFPARSAFQVAALPAGGLVEIEVVAAL